MIGRKTCVALLVGIAAIGYRNINKGKTYRNNLKTWKEPDVQFKTPTPMDQSMLYKTVPEITDPLEVQAGADTIPNWLTGTLLRDGPGLFEFGAEVALHAFDGMAMIRRYHVNQGHSLNFSRKLIESDILRENRKEARFTKYGVGTPAKTTPLDRLKGIGQPGADNVVVQSLNLFGHIYASTELPQVIEYDPITLKTLGKVDISDRIPGIQLMTPHPMYDQDGTMWNVAMARGPDRHGKSTGFNVWRYVIFKVTPPQTEEERRDPWLNLEIVSELGSSRALSISYLHSFFMTERYLIFTEQPWIFGCLPEVLYKHVWQGKNYGASMSWDAGSMLGFHVLEKSTGIIKSTKYEGDPMGFYHIFNAYEEDGFLILDAPFKAVPISYEVFYVEQLAGSPDSLRDYMISNGPAAGLAKRWVLPLTVPETFTPPEELKKTVDGLIDPNSYQLLTSLKTTAARAWHVGNDTVYLQPELLAPPEQLEYHRAIEFVAINPKHAGKKYRYSPHKCTYISDPKIS